MKKKIGEYRIKNRYLIYLIICSFFLGSFLGVIVHPVSAASFVYKSGFQEQVIGSDFNISLDPNHLFYSKQKTAPFKVDSGRTGTPLKGFNIIGDGWFNLSYSQSLFLTNFSFWARINCYGSSYYGTIYYYNNSLGVSNPIVKTTIVYNYPNIWLSYWVGGSQVFLSQSMAINMFVASWHKFSFKILNDVGDIQYTSNMSYDVTGSACNSTAIHNGYRIDRVYFDSSYYSGFIDDLNMTLKDSYESYETGCASPVVADMYGINEIFCSDTVTSPYMEKQYSVPFTGDVLGVDLAVNPSQFTDDPNLIHYFLWVNGESFGNPSCFFENEYGYVLRWSFLKPIDDAVIVLEFQHMLMVYSRYWLPGIACTSSSDLDGDGDMTYRIHGSSGGINGIYSGNIRNYDLGTIIYYDNSVFINETSPYSDLITCPKTTYNTFDTIPISFFVSDFTYSNSIQLWRNGTQKTDAVQGFPYSVLTGDFFGELSYAPLLSGRYQFRIVRNGYVKSSFNVTVTGPVDMNFILAVFPNPCKFNTEAIIHFRFYPSDGADGFIGVSEFPDTSGFSSFDESWLLSANTTGNKSFYPQTNMYVSLWKKSGNSSYVRVVIKYLKMYSLFDNTINVLYKSIQLSEANPTVTQRIYGTQIVQGFNTFVRMNNKHLQYVTDTPFYNVYVDITKGGNYNAELCMETANGSKVLCRVNFTVSSPPRYFSGGGAEAFPAEMKLLFGICCILVAVCCPLMISVKYHVAVPTFVYVVFMAFGIGIGTVLGFLELWLVFLFVVALVAGAVFTIFGHGGQGGGGGDSGTARKGGILSRKGGKDYAGASRKADYGVSPKGSPGYLKGPGRRGY